MRPRIDEGGGGGFEKQRNCLCADTIDREIFAWERRRESLAGWNEIRNIEKTDRTISNDYNAYNISLHVARI